MSRMNKRQQGSSSSTSYANPRREGSEHYNAVTLGCGRELEASKEVEKPLDDTKEA